ncbi:MAG: LamG-like jellyroll fold domain-containing protein, partial [Candidatus Paceibacterota bacterium]
DSSSPSISNSVSPSVGSTSPSESSSYSPSLSPSLSISPSVSSSISPSVSSSISPSISPSSSKSPSISPSSSISPSVSISLSPSKSPSVSPSSSLSPSKSPSVSPSSSLSPSKSPSVSPSSSLSPSKEVMPQEYAGAGTSITQCLLHFQGNCTDSSGNGFTSYPSGVSYSNSYGVINNGISFDGAASYVIGPSINIYGSNHFTCSFWFKADESKSTGVFMGRYNTGVDGSWKISKTGSGTLAFLVSDRNVTANYRINVWNQLMCVFNALTQTAYVYVNGYLAGSSDGSTQMSSTGATMYIGCGESNNVREAFYKGYMDDFFIEKAYWDQTAVDAYLTYYSASPSASPSYSYSTSPSDSPSVSPS